MNSDRYSVTIVQSECGEYELERVFTGYCLPDARYHAEMYCKHERIKVLTKLPKTGRIASDKNNVVWHVVGMKWDEGCMESAI